MKEIPRGSLNIRPTEIPPLPYGATVHLLRKRERWLSYLPRNASKKLRRDAEAIARTSGAIEANRYLAGNVEPLRAAKVHIAFDEDELEYRARSLARHCLHLRTIAVAHLLCAQQGVAPPKGRNVTEKGTLRRMREYRWWRRRLRALYSRRAENAFRGIGMVHKLATPYVTPDGLERFMAQQRNNAAFLKAHDMVNCETGEILPLHEIAARSLSNPSIRRTDVMTRVGGFERFSAKRGDDWIHVTLTCPSAFHAYRVEGVPNPRWNGEGVTSEPYAKRVAARDWLQRTWARARSKLKRLSVVYYGLRTAEPHHDATPHWHMLIFAKPEALATIETVLRDYWLSEYGDEPGAAERRVDVQPSHGELGTAAGYVAKYISKNTDGHNLASDDPRESDLGGSAAAKHVIGWARIHGIRQFQQIGGPSVTLWRELRRLREVCEVEAIERVRAPADAGKWDEFIESLGGIEVCRSTPPVMLDKELPRRIDSMGREVLRLNGYGEIPEPRAIGVKCISAGRWCRVLTRLAEWIRVRCSILSRGPASDLGPVSTTVRGPDDINSPAGWTNPNESSTYGPE